MWIFPLASTMISAFFSGIVLRQYLAGRRPAYLAWAFALFLFGLGTACDFLAGIGGWTPLIAKTYYLAGATLVVGYLSLGTLYLLAPRIVARTWLLAMLFLTAATVVILARSGIDLALLHSATEPGWQAIERPAALKIIMIAINGAGSLIIVGGAVYSALRGRYRQANLLIALGTLIVAAAGSLAASGRLEFHAISQTLGITVMFIGFLMTAAASRESQTVPTPA